MKSFNFYITNIIISAGTGFIEKLIVINDNDVIRCRGVFLSGSEFRIVN